MRKPLAGLIVLGLLLSLAACGGNDEERTGVNANMGATVGIAMPTRVSQRWRADGDNMVEQFAQMGYKTDLQFGDDDVANQISQIQAMIDRHYRLLVIGAIDNNSLTAVLAKAAKAKIPVIAYNRLIRGTPDVDYYVAFDGSRVGKLQAELLATRLGLAQGKGPYTIELFAGAPDDSNAIVFYNSAMDVLKPYLKSGQLVVKSQQTRFADVSTPRWDVPDTQLRMTRILGNSYTKTRLDAVLSPLDGMSIGMIKVLKTFGYGTAAKPLPVISGQDASIDSIKAIIANEQAGTVFQDTRELAKVAVQMGNALLTGATPMTNDRTTYNNGAKVVPAYLLQPITVDKTNYETLLVSGGYYAKSDLD